MKDRESGVRSQESGVRSQRPEAGSQRPEKGLSGFRFPASGFGFTLLEIMIAMAILSISLLSLYSAIGNSLRASGMAEDMSQAMLLGRQRMAEVMMSVEEDMSRGAFPDENEENGVFEKPFERFKWSYTIKKVEIPVINPPGGLGDLANPSGSAAPSPSGAPTTPGVENAASNMAQIVSKKISESIRELKLTISWGEGESEEEMEKVVLTTHLAKLK